MTFVGTVTYPAVRWFNSALTSSDDVTLTTYPTAVASGSQSVYIIRPTPANPDDSYQSQKSRARGLAIYPITEGTGSDEDKKYSFQLVGWVLGASKTNPATTTYEQRPLALWTGDVTLGDITSTNWQDGSGSITIRMAKTLTEVTGFPPSIAGLAGATPIIHNRAATGGDKSDSFIVIPDISHLFWGLTIRTNISAAGEMAAPNANFLVQYVF